MELRQVMTTHIRCVTPGSSLSAAAATMKELDVGVLPVCDDDKITGMITDRDLVVRGLANGDDPNKLTVSDVMTPGVVWCYEDDDVSVAAALMQSRQIRRLPIISREKRLVGMVTLGDLAVRGRDDRLSGQTLEVVSKPAEIVAGAPA